MQIKPQHTGDQFPEPARSWQPADVAETDAIPSVPPTPSSADRSDKVSIPRAGRILVARDGGAERASLDPVRASQIRERVLCGAYDTLEVVDAVARRLLDRGDL